MRTRHWLLLALALPVACAIDGDGGAFDDDENDDSVGIDSKADGTGSTGYRSGCTAPIRTGSYTLHGDLALPTGIAPDSYLTVTDEKIAAIGSTPPAGIPVVETHGIIFPGLIDGHGHVEYNHVPLADLGRRYQNRDQWPDESRYRTLVKDPKNAVTAAGLQCTALRHGEARALVGGTTAIQGTPSLACTRSLVRNIETVNFCQDRIRQNVTSISGFTRSISGKPSFTDSIKSDLAAHRLDAFIVHAGEGIDEHARVEWDQLTAQGLVVPELVMIHATAFGAKELAAAGAAGAKIVWSPLSNLLLYGKTTDIPTAMASGVLVSLGSDWAPSGSANLLGELKVADHVNQRLWGGRITDQQLVDMVTINPAKTFGWSAFAGSLEVGKTADLLVVQPHRGVSAYRSLIDANPQDVLLVTIAGDPLFGSTDLLEALGKSGDYEVIDTCGTPRGIDVTVTARDVPNGSQSLADIESKLATVNPRLTPVVDCTNDEMLKAFAGTPLQ